MLINAKPRTSTPNCPARNCKPVLNPRLAMAEVPAGERVHAAKKGPPDTAGDAVVDADFGEVNQQCARNPGHVTAPVGWRLRVPRCRPMRTNAHVSLEQVNGRKKIIMGGPALAHR